MKRETLNITAKEAEDILWHQSDYYFDKAFPPEWKIVSTYETDVDRDQSSSTQVVILKRLSDGKFFKGEYTNGYAGEQEFPEQRLWEVEEKTKTITYYE